MEHLRELRTSKGISQQAVADYLGITRQAYSNYENDNREPDKETLLKLAEYFDTSVDVILRGKEKAPAPEGERSKDPDIRKIERAKSRMTEKEWAKQMRIIEASFGDYFSDNYEDDDTDE